MKNKQEVLRSLIAEYGHIMFQYGHDVIMTDPDAERRVDYEQKISNDLFSVIVHLLKERKI